ncbi:MAG: hypothetical protein JNJ88_07975 [Planctomycetes bacterium]|nr:hypothetical protein [Planctomycetota bacterium]
MTFRFVAPFVIASLGTLLTPDAWVDERCSALAGSVLELSQKGGGGEKKPGGKDGSGAGKGGSQKGASKDATERHAAPDYSKATGEQIAKNAAADRAEAEELKAQLGEAPTVISSAHFSLKGAIEAEAAREALELAEQAYAELNIHFEKPANAAAFPSARGGKIHCYFLRDPAAVRELLPYLESKFGALEPYLRQDVLKGSGKAANATNSFAITKSDVDPKTYLLHQLGQVYIEAFIAGETPPAISEGFGVYVAVRWGGKNTTYCFNPDSYKGSVGKTAKGEDTAYLLLCKEMAQDKSDASFEALVKRKLNQLDDKDIAKLWSLVRMWMETEPEEGSSFLKLFSAKQVARVLKASYRMTPAEFDDHWRELHR